MNLESNMFMSVHFIVPFLGISAAIFGKNCQHISWTKFNDGAHVDRSCLTTRLRNIAESPAFCSTSHIK